MWGYGGLVIFEVGMCLMLFRRYWRRRSTRIASDLERLREEQMRHDELTQSLHVIRHQRDLIQELRDLLR